MIQDSRRSSPSVIKAREIQNMTFRKKFNLTGHNESVVYEGDVPLSSKSRSNTAEEVRLLDGNRRYFGKIFISDREIEKQGSAGIMITFKEKPAGYNNNPLTFGPFEKRDNFYYTFVSLKAVVKSTPEVALKRSSNADIQWDQHVREEVLNQLIDKTEIKKYTKGEVIIRENEISPGVYQLASGSVRIVKGSLQSTSFTSPPNSPSLTHSPSLSTPRESTPKPSQQIFGNINRGDLMGEMAYLDKLPMAVSMVADSSEVEVYFIPEEELRALPAEPRSVFNKFLAAYLASNLGRSTASISQLPQNLFDKKQAHLQALFGLDSKQSLLKKTKGQWNDRIDAKMYLSPDYICISGKMFGQITGSWSMADIASIDKSGEKSLEFTSHKRGHFKERFTFMTEAIRDDWVSHVTSPPPDPYRVESSEAQSPKASRAFPENSETDSSEDVSLFNLLNNANVKSYQKGQSILMGGEIPQGLYQVMQGSVAVVRNNSIVARLGVGQMFAEIAFLLGGEATASIISDEDNTEICILNVHFLHCQLNQDFPLRDKFYFNICQIIAQRLRKSAAALNNKQVEKVVDFNLVARMKEEKGGVPVKDRKQMLTNYKRTFSGKDAVQWLISTKESSTREEAVALWQNLLSEGIIWHITREHGFMDDSNMYYQFSTKEQIEGRKDAVKQGLLEFKPAGKWKLCWADVDATNWTIYKPSSKGSLEEKLTVLQLLPVGDVLQIVLRDSETASGMQKNEMVVVLKDQDKSYKIRAESETSAAQWILAVDEAAASEDRRAELREMQRKENQLWYITDMSAAKPVWKKSSDTASLIDVACRKEGFNIETGSSQGTNDWASLYDFPIESLERYTAFYKEYIYPSKHHNYYAADANRGPIFASVEEQSPHHHTVKVLFRTRKADIRISVPVFSEIRTSPEVFLFSATIEAKLELSESWIKLDSATTTPPSTPGSSSPLSFPGTPRSSGSVQRPSSPPPLQINVTLQSLLDFEKKVLGDTRYKFGVIRIRQGQGAKDEDSIMANESGRDFDEFLECLGNKINLQGWTGFAGGLDVKSNSTGIHSVFAQHESCEVMFHVAPYLPYYPDDKQQVERKRHIGNDIVIIIFKENTDPDYFFNPLMIRSQFNHVFIVVQKLPTEPGKGVRYHVEVVNKFGVLPYGPALPEPPIFNKGEKFSKWLLTKCINGERSSMNAPDFRDKVSSTRSSLMKEIVANLRDKKVLPPTAKILSEPTGRRKAGSILRRW
ncbi:RapGAP/RanGAP domain-containing protein [Planoprotostelium fungivorum]|uniref:RapGAP/RanGAP domain-containing protein n=1 Tax=Planoprotostelium fungivorum TaxID=1890364 RepID=A0A2P6NAX5_9EUKA|nr:RapGAP/RanGAP domain-containing protein [Planoprotostelium fungivorum]